MSFLTKLFVVSLVVLSLLLSAAAITFVNAVDDYKVDLETTKNAVAKAEAAATEAKTNSDAEVAGLRDSLAAANASLTAANAKLTDAVAKRGESDIQLVAAGTRAQTAELNVTRLSAGLAAAQATQTQLQTQVADLRVENTRLQTQNGEVGLALEDVTQKFNVTNEQLRDANEQLTQAKADNDRVSGALLDLGGDPKKITSSGLAAGAPPINGVIRATRLINNLPHAQISVGSDDGVKKDMEFTVVDRTTGQFLGRLKIVAVEPNEAIGRLEGPNVTTIAAGAEVRTQL